MFIFGSKHANIRVVVEQHHPFMSVSRVVYNSHETRDVNADLECTSKLLKIPKWPPSGVFWFFGFFFGFCFVLFCCCCWTFWSYFLLCILVNTCESWSFSRKGHCLVKSETKITHYYVVYCHLCSCGRKFKLIMLCIYPHVWANFSLILCSIMWNSKILCMKNSVNMK